MAERNDYARRILAANIRRRRTELGLSQPALAARTNLSSQTISGYENERAMPGTRATEALAVALEVTPEALFDPYPDPAARQEAVDAAKAGAPQPGKKRGTRRAASDDPPR